MNFYTLTFKARDVSYMKHVLWMCLGNRECSIWSSIVFIYTIINTVRALYLCICEIIFVCKDKSQQST